MKKVQKEAINQEILKHTIDLVKAGNDKIQQTVEKSILLLGKTGSGKSTLATLMAGRELQAIRDDEEGVLVIDALNPLKDIIISNRKMAETRIPNKCSVGDVVIWDCPGFHDNRGIAQEIANSFYIKRLLETTKAVKFVLVVPESALDSNRGIDFVDTVNQLMGSFKDPKVIEGCISLVVTAVSPGRQTIHILKSIERITKQNELISPEVAKIIERLKKSVHVFHKPSAEGELKVEYDFLAAIDQSTQYTANIAEHARISIASNSMNYVRHILENTQKQFSELVNIILTTASKDHGLFNRNSKLSSSYQTVEKLLPDSVNQLPVKNSPEHKDDKEIKHFADIAALSDLGRVVSTGSNLAMDNSDVVLAFLNNILKVYEEYTDTKGGQKELLNKQIHGYSYLLNQQMEYIKFFSKVCGHSVSDYLGTLKEPIKSCKEAISRESKEAVKLMTVDQNHTDPEYYKTALKYLKHYGDEEWSTKAQAKIHLYLAGLSEDRESINHCLKSISLDKTLLTTYGKLGDLLCKTKDYKKAIKYYKIIDNILKIEQCYKEIFKVNPDSTELRVEAGDYFASIGRYEKATKFYQHASSLSYDNSFKAAMLNKINHVMDERQITSKEFAKKAENHEFHNLDLMDMDELHLGGEQHDEHYS